MEIFLKFLVFFIYFIFQLKWCNTLTSNFKFKYDNFLSRIKIHGNHFVDEFDRAVLFHGINAVEKSFPWLPNQNVQCNLSNQTQINNL